MRPLCLGASWSVRATSMHHLAWCANVVQTFWPVTTQSPSSLTALRLERGEVGARLGLGEALAPDLLGREDRLEVALLLLLGAVGDHHRAAHREAEHVRRRAGALARTISSLKIACSISVAPRPPYSLGHETPGPAAPRAASSATRGGSRSLLLVALRLLARVVLLEPRAQLVAEGFLLWLRASGPRVAHRTWGMVVHAYAVYKLLVNGGDLRAVPDAARPVIALLKEGIGASSS